MPKVRPQQRSPAQDTDFPQAAESPRSPLHKGKKGPWARSVPGGLQMSLHAALAKQQPRSTAGAGERGPGRRPRSVYYMGQQPTATVCQGQQRQRGSALLGGNVLVHLEPLPSPWGYFSGYSWKSGVTGFVTKQFSELIHKCSLFKK